MQRKLGLGPRDLDATDQTTSLFMCVRWQARGVRRRRRSRGRRKTKGQRKKNSKTSHTTTTTHLILPSPARGEHLLEVQHSVQQTGLVIMQTGSTCQRSHRNSTQDTACACGANEVSKTHKMTKNMKKNMKKKKKSLSRT